MFGTVATSVSVTGACTDGKALCFLNAEDVAKVEVGDKASVGGQQLAVREVASVPLSRSEAHDILGSDYLVSAFYDGDWAYPVYFEGDVGGLAQDVPLAIEITTERVAPITLLFG